MVEFVLKPNLLRWNKNDDGDDLHNFRVGTIYEYRFCEPWN